MYVIPWKKWSSFILFWIAIKDAAIHPLLFLIESSWKQSLIFMSLRLCFVCVPHIDKKVHMVLRLWSFAIFIRDPFVKIFDRAIFHLLHRNRSYLMTFRKRNCNSSIPKVLQCLKDKIKHPRNYTKSYSCLKNREFHLWIQYLFHIIDRFVRFILYYGHGFDCSPREEFTTKKIDKTLPCIIWTGIWPVPLMIQSTKRLNFHDLENRCYVHVSNNSKYSKTVRIWIKIYISKRNENKLIQIYYGKGLQVLLKISSNHKNK